jgi:hypothetical protein
VEATERARIVSQSARPFTSRLSSRHACAVRSKARVAVYAEPAGTRSDARVVLRAPRRHQSGQKCGLPPPHDRRTIQSRSAPRDCRGPMPSMRGVNAKATVRFTEQAGPTTASRDRAHHVDAAVLRQRCARGRAGRRRACSRGEPNRFGSTSRSTSIRRPARAGARGSRSSGPVRADPQGLRGAHGTTTVGPNGPNGRGPASPPPAAALGPSSFCNDPIARRPIRATCRRFELEPRGADQRSDGLVRLSQAGQGGSQSSSTVTGSRIAVEHDQPPLRPGATAPSAASRAKCHGNESR